MLKGKDYTVKSKENSIKKDVKLMNSFFSSDISQISLRQDISYDMEERAMIDKEVKEVVKK